MEVWKVSAYRCEFLAWEPQAVTLGENAPLGYSENVSVIGEK